MHTVGGLMWGILGNVSLAHWAFTHAISLPFEDMLLWKNLGIYRYVAAEGDLMGLFSLRH